MHTAKLFLVRHAEALPSPDQPEADWPLSAQGNAQAHQLIDLLSKIGAEKIVSSPYLRARETVRPFAESNQIKIEIDPDLRERLIATSWIEDFSTAINIVHGDTSLSLPGGESARAALVRFQGALERIVTNSPGGRIIVATHGAVIAHLMRSHIATLPADYHVRIERPHVFELEWSSPPRWVGEVRLSGSPSGLFGAK